jgi:hypothetical protein
MRCALIFVVDFRRRRDKPGGDDAGVISNRPGTALVDVNTQSLIRASKAAHHGFISSRRSRQSRRRS